MSFWDVHEKKIDPENFRADDQYLGEQNSYPYQAMADYIYGQMNNLYLDEEDGAFGAITVDLPMGQGGTYKASRDLFDSRIEMNFLDDSGVNLHGQILDIGAGYGRMAHRITEAYSDAFVWCTDAVPVSREICQRYLDFRKVTRAKVVEPEALGKIGHLDLAIAVHSFPEMTRADIVKWLGWLQVKQVPKLFVVPHPFVAPMTCLEDGASFMPEILEHGFKQTHHWRGPDVWPRDFFLFEGP